MYLFGCLGSKNSYKLKAYLDLRPSILLHKVTRFVWVVSIVAAWYFAACSQISEQKPQNLITAGAIDPQTELRKIYPNSVIPGGVYSGAELARARRIDPVVADHYQDFGNDAHVTRLQQDELVYVSYRKADKVLWTKKQHKVCKGEAVVVDGKNNMARSRCGNRLSKTPQLPTTDNEPTEAMLNKPVVSIPGGGPAGTGAGPESSPLGGGTPGLGSGLSTNLAGPDIRSGTSPDGGLVPGYTVPTGASNGSSTSPLGTTPADSGASKAPVFPAGGLASGISPGYGSPLAVANGLSPNTGTNTTGTGTTGTGTTGTGTGATGATGTTGTGTGTTGTGTGTTGTGTGTGSTGTGTGTTPLTPVPEPGTVFLMFAGGASLLVLRKLSRRR